MYTVSRESLTPGMSFFSSIAAIILVSSSPARPTNGSPRASSSAPGASPTNTMPVRAEPTPGTAFVRVVQSPHLVHARASVATVSSTGSASTTSWSRPPSSADG